MYLGFPMEILRGGVLGEEGPGVEGPGSEGNGGLASGTFFFFFITFFLAGGVPFWSSAAGSAAFEVLGDDVVKRD